MSAPITFPALTPDVHRDAASQGAAAEHVHGGLRTRFEHAEAGYRLLGRGAPALARAAVGLAIAEKMLGRCAHAEAVLSNALSTLAWGALERPGTLLTARLESADAAQWCAAELSELYLDHTMPSHAAAVQKAAVEIGRRASSGADLS